MAHCRAPRQLARLGAVLAAGCFAFGLVTTGVAPAATPSAPLGDGRMVPATALAVALSRPGYQCLSDAKLVGAKPGQVGSLAVHLDGYVVAYSAAESHLSTGLFAYPGTLKVSEGSRSWTMPPPADPKDQYFQLGGLCAVQFGPGGAPDVLGEGFWGGAHCCFRPNPVRILGGLCAYRVVEDLTKPGVGEGLHWNPNGGFQPERVGGSVVLESSDGAFPYAFGCYACTPAPTRLFTVAEGQLLDVTTRYPAVIRAEADAAWRIALGSMRAASDVGLVEGPLAQWAADKCELDQGPRCGRRSGSCKRKES